MYPSEFFSNSIVFLRFTCIVYVLFSLKFTYVQYSNGWIEHNLFILSLVNNYLVLVIFALQIIMGIMRKFLYRLF